MKRIELTKRVHDFGNARFAGRRITSILVVFVMVLSALVMVVSNNVAAVATTISPGVHYTFYDTPWGENDAGTTWTGARWIEASHRAEAFCNVVEYQTIDELYANAKVGKTVRPDKSGMFNVTIGGHIHGAVEAILLTMSHIWFRAQIIDTDTNTVVKEHYIWDLFVAGFAADHCDKDFIAQMEFYGNAQTTYALCVWVKTQASSIAIGGGFADAYGAEGIEIYYTQVQSENAVFYEDWANSHSPDWVYVTSGGSATVDETKGSYDNPSLKLARTVSTGSVSASHDIEPQLGRCIVQARLMPSARTPMTYFFLMSGSSCPVYAGFCPYGPGMRFGIMDGTTWRVVAPGIVNAWNSVMFDLNCAAGTYDVWFDGQKVWTGANFCTIDREVNKVRFQAADPGAAYVTLWVDDVIVRKGTLLAYDQFQDGSITDWTIRSDGGVVQTDNLNGGYAKPALKVSKTTPAGGASALKTFATQTSHMLVEFRVKASGTNPWDYVCLRGDGAYQVYFALRNGYFAYYDGTWHNLMGYTNNNWQRVTLDVDVTNGKFSVLIDGTWYFGGLNFNSAPSRYINEFYVQAAWYGSGSGVTIWVDDVTITT